MGIHSVVLCFMISTVFAAPEDVAASLAKYAELQKKSASITKESTEKDVIAILGESLGNYIFIGVTSLYLESMAFSG